MRPPVFGLFVCGLGSPHLGDELGHLDSLELGLATAHDPAPDALYRDGGGKLKGAHGIHLCFLDSPFHRC